MLILRFFGFGEFDLVAESETRAEVAALIRARLKPGLIFQRVLERLVRQRVVIPSYDLLNKLILDQIGVAAVMEKFPTLRPIFG